MSTNRGLPNQLGPEITLRLSGDRRNLVATLPSGQILNLVPEDAGKILITLLRSKPSDLPAAPLAPIYRILAEYERVCHCGKSVEPFMEKCADCPGYYGAGKIHRDEVRPMRYTARGKPQRPSLAELGLLD